MLFFADVAVFRSYIFIKLCFFFAQEPVSGLADIKAKIEHLGLGGATVDLGCGSVDAQPSEGGERSGGNQEVRCDGFLIRPPSPCGVKSRQTLLFLTTYDSSPREVVWNQCIYLGRCSGGPVNQRQFLLV